MLCLRYDIIHHNGGMDMKKCGIICIFLCMAHISAMMQEDQLPRSGKLLLQHELPAALAVLLSEKEYPKFAMRRTSYEMDEHKTVLAIQGVGPAVKIFSHNDGVFEELQELEKSASPAMHPGGTELAVLKAEVSSRVLDYYIREGDHPKFLHRATLQLNNSITDISFNKDGSRLRVDILVGTAKSETREFIRSNNGGLEPIGFVQKIIDRVSSIVE